MTCRNLSFKEIEGTSKLFLDFLYDFEKVAPYYCADYKNIERFRLNAGKIAGREYHREVLIDILTDQNKAFGIGEQTFANINKLANNRTCVVFTGQQVGVLTGPLYTIYKTLTIVKLAEYLSRELEIDVIPIFWMAADDHDFEEVSHIHVIDKNNQISKFYYQPREMPDNIPMAFFNLDENIKTFTADVMDNLAETEFLGAIRELAEEAYQPDRTLCDAFGIMLGHLFRDSGLVIVNPADVRIKKLAAPIYKKEIESFEQSNQIIFAANQELSALGYHQQVNRVENYLNLFYFTGQRSRVGFEDGHYFIDGIQKKFTKEEMLKTVDDNPNYFSPNVLLRPVSQDYIFPTLAYIGGPAEVAYFAQIKDLHNHFGVQCPIVYPRITATIIDQSSLRTAEKYNLKLMDLADEKAVQARIKELVESMIPDGLSNKMEQDREEIIAKILELDSYLEELDQGVRKTVQKTKGKVEFELKSLREKILKAFKKQNDTLVTSVTRSADFLFPESSLQERHLNVLTFINKYGPEFVNIIAPHLKLERHDHQIICFDDIGL